jgi:hypothetical protein
MLVCLCLFKYVIRNGRYVRSNRNGGGSIWIDTGTSGTCRPWMGIWSALHSKKLFKSQFVVKIKFYNLFILGNL